ncbi:hypothetical protein F8154_07040 [Alkaliphilus pronyensis]|uniref:Uncharacterized protein n=1 Tax=Alkaliphilus pronyensis TaxID=1482732 RepID=A0A6I0FC72_9FIRM|nr:hypothetical protein [Alkaliphilus pronyensis]KAB3535340.1 hypothetical protein F8154_07040 [Alkaliphilus pronyensis]
MESVERKIIGYDNKGKPVYERFGLITSCCVECLYCKKLLATAGGPKKIICSTCAEKAGVIVRM